MKKNRFASLPEDFDLSLYPVGELTEIGAVECACGAQMRTHVSVGTAEGAFHLEHFCPSCWRKTSQGYKTEGGEHQRYSAKVIEEGVNSAKITKDY